jgi:hypothetical protein
MSRDQDQDFYRIGPPEDGGRDRSVGRYDERGYEIADRGYDRGCERSYHDPRPPIGDVPNYLVQAILCTLCCCVPGGVVALVYAAQVNSKVAAGDVRGAVAASENAKMWCWLSFGISLVVNVLYMIARVAFVQQGVGAGGSGRSGAGF